jgi:hypothetical protein
MLWSTSVETCTQQVKEQLNDLKAVLFPSDNNLLPDTLLFIYCFHDWLAYLTDQPTRLYLHDTSLYNVIKEKTAGLSSRYLQWLSETLGNTSSLKTLLYRHYMVDYVLSQEIFSRTSYSPWYLLVGSMLTNPSTFSPCPGKHCFDRLGHYPHLIDGLRQEQSVIRQVCHDLAMQDNECFPLVSDHAQLSALSLLYGLHLTRVILLYQQRISPTDYLSDVNQALFTTLTHLQGVLIHGKD